MRGCIIRYFPHNRPDPQVADGALDASRLEADGQLVCAFSHLTDFGGFIGPMPTANEVGDTFVSGATDWALLVCWRHWAPRQAQRQPLVELYGGCYGGAKGVVMTEPQVSNPLEFGRWLDNPVSGVTDCVLVGQRTKIVQGRPESRSEPQRDARPPAGRRGHVALAARRRGLHLLLEPAPLLREPALHPRRVRRFRPAHDRARGGRQHLYQ